MVVFCPIPDFATCSLALLKPLVSVVVNGLSTCASHTLSTLAPILFCSQKTCQNDFVFFFTSMTTLCVSSLWYFFSQHRLVGFFGILYKQYSRFTIYDFSIFRFPNFSFRRVIAGKNFNSIFLEDKGYVWVLSVPSAWKCFCFRTSWWNTFQMSGLLWYLWRNGFFSQFPWRKAVMFEFLRNNNSPLCFVFLTLVFYNRFCRIRWLMS